MFKGVSMVGLILRIKRWTRERKQARDPYNTRPVAMVKERDNVYRFVWADELSDTAIKEKLD